MRRAGGVVRAALEAAVTRCVPGATTSSIDAAGSDLIARLGAEAIFRGLRPAGSGRAFPAALCVSVNDEVIHGVPGARVLLDGDLVSIDCGVRVDGWCADAAVTVCVGRPSEPRAALLETGARILRHAVDSVVPGVRWSTIASRLEAIAESAGFALVPEYVGHGIGRQLHEWPEVPCCDVTGGDPRRDFTLRPGMTLAIEPILVEGSPQTRPLQDGWTVATADGGAAVHFEHTIAVTPQGCEVLTGTNGECSLPTRCN